MFTADLIRGRTDLVTPLVIPLRWVSLHRCLERSACQILATPLRSDLFFFLTSHALSIRIYMRRVRLVFATTYSL